MALTYQLDLELGVLFLTAGSIISVDDLVRVTDALHRNDAYKPGTPVLADLRAIEKLQINGEAIRDRIQLDLQSSDRIGPARIAMVATHPAVFGTARMYETLAESSPTEVRVFEDLDSARRWLGLPEVD